MTAYATTVEWSNLHGASTARTPFAATSQWLAPLVQRVAGSLFVAATLTAPAIGSTLSGDELYVRPIGDSNPGTASSRWADARAMIDHMAMRSPDLQQFLQQMPGADAGAVCAIFDLAIQQFQDRESIDTRYRCAFDDDLARLNLFFEIDTHGLDIDEVIDRQLRINQAIIDDARLSQAAEYLLLSIY